MIRDKSLGIFLAVLFGLSGIAIITLAWLQPMSGAERIISSFIGSAGVLVALDQSRRIKSVSGSTDGKVMVSVRVDDKS